MTIPETTFDMMLTSTWILHAASVRGGSEDFNGVARPRWVKPPPPPEVANWVIEPVPPEVAEYFRRTFDEAAFLSEMEETLKTGGADVDALIARIERKVHARD